MSQCTPAEAAMTCLNPHAHHISVTSSQSWDWLVRTPKPRSLSREAKKRYRWLRWHATHGRNVSLTCRHHGISRRTFYRWQHRFEQHGLVGLADRSHRPQRGRRPTWTAAQVAAVLRVREQYPAWGKAKLAVLLRREGMVLSISMMGRYACTVVEPRLEALQPALRAYEDTYNTIRPHQALGYLTPQEYLDKQKEAA